MKCSTTIVVASALALAATTINPNAAHGGTSRRCLTTSVHTTMELDRTGALMRTRFSNGRKELGQAIRSGRAVVRFGPTVVHGRVVNAVSISDPFEPTTAAAEASARAAIPLSDTQIDRVIAQFLAGRLAFKTVKSATATIAIGASVDPSEQFATVRTRTPRAVRVLAPGDIYDYGCISDKKEFTKYGCYRRHGGYASTSTRRYLLDDNQATGHGTRVWVASKLGMKNTYSSATTVIQWSPGADVTVGACRTITASLGFQGTGVSVSAPVCPDKVHPSVGLHEFSSVWLGHSDGQTEGSDGMNLVAINRPHASGFSSRLDWDDCWLGWSC